MLIRTLFPGNGTDSNKLVQQMTAKGYKDLTQLFLGNIGTSVFFIYGIGPLLHQPLQPEHLYFKESANKHSEIGFESMALDPSASISELY